MKPGVEVDHAQPENLRRRALELSRRLGLCRRRNTATTKPRREDFVAALYQQRAGARLRRARRHHDLRPARHRRRADLLGERGLSRAQGTRRRTSSRSSCRRSRSRPSRRSPWSTATSTPRARARSPRPISSSSTATRPEDHRQQLLSPGEARGGRSAGPEALRRHQARHHRRSVFGGWKKAQTDALRRRRHLRPDLQADELIGSRTDKIDR